jgi:hypothetical protein
MDSSHKYTSLAITNLPKSFIGFTGNNIFYFAANTTHAAYAAYAASAAYSAIFRFFWSDIGE